jgi:hypothetical protein
MLTDSRNLRAFTETTEVSGGCQWKFSADSRACSTKFERSAQDVGACARDVLVGNYAQEGKLTLALQWIVRSGRSFLRYRLPA